MLLSVEIRKIQIKTTTKHGFHLLNGKALKQQWIVFDTGEKGEAVVLLYYWESKLDTTFYKSTFTMYINRFKWVCNIYSNK